MLRSLAKRLAFGIHRLGLRFGIQITPVHYYSPLASVRELERTRRLWARASTLPGLGFDADAQTATLRRICLPYREEYAPNRAYADYAATAGPGFGFVEAQALHAVVRHLKPARVLEVGSGVSTFCCRAAAEINRRETGAAAAITCVEPFPSERLERESGIELIRSRVQEVPLERFRALERGDLLFIDSSHTVRPGGDVNFLVLEVLPRLESGVVVHFHDIFLPFDYQPGVLKTFFHWTETSLLRAFLAFNDAFEVLFCLSYLHHQRPGELTAAFPGYRPLALEDGLYPADVPPLAYPGERGHLPASIYLRRT